MRSILFTAVITIHLGACATDPEQRFSEAYSLYQEGDVEAALQQWQTLAEQEEHVRAQYNLGQMYRLGLGVEADDEQAAFWYQKAATANLPQARHNLKLMERDGRIPEPDAQSPEPAASP